MTIEFISVISSASVSLLTIVFSYIQHRDDNKIEKGKIDNEKGKLNKDYISMIAEQLDKSGLNIESEKKVRSAFIQMLGNEDDNKYYDNLKVIKNIFEGK